MKIKLCGIPLNICGKEEYFSSIKDALSDKSKKIFFYLNTQSFYLFHKNKEFREAFLKADYVSADGYSIIWACEKLIRSELQKVVFTYYFFENLAQYFSERKISIFLLGANDQTLKKAIENIQANYAGINILGSHHGYFDDEKETAEVISEIEKSKPDVLLVGMGMPRSEIWITKNANQVKANCTFSVGGFIDYAAGEKRLAPVWLYNSGFEWLYRLIHEPKRLAGRYLTAHSYFLYRIIKEAIKK